MNNTIPDDYVKIATKVCPVCGCEHKHNSEILIHKNLKSIKGEPITGYELCEDHEQKFDEGYLALIEIEQPATEGLIKQENAVRTGNIVHMRRQLFDDVFDTKVDKELPLVFIEIGVISKLQSLMEK